VLTYCPCQRARDREKLQTNGGMGLAVVRRLRLEERTPPGVAAFDDEMTLTAAVDTSNGTNVSLTCNPDGLGFARDVVITAVRVGTLHTETP
jgi:hypothetical protein